MFAAGDMASSSPSSSSAAAAAALKSPKKGILKKHAALTMEDETSPKAAAGRRASAGYEKSARWDEMNILQTYHPADKDYGHMKIEEPKTPYNYVDPSEGDDAGVVNADEVEKRLHQSDHGAIQASHFCGSHVSLSSEDDLDDAPETPEQRAHRESFERHRKAHYNEGHLLRDARRAVQQELEQLAHEDEKASDPDDGNAMVCDPSNSGASCNNGHAKVTSSHEGPSGASL